VSADAVDRSAAYSRVTALLVAARRLADPADELGRSARNALVMSTRLSLAGVEWALRECLELSPSEPELMALLGSVRPAPAAHVLLPANVFVAAHRAIALALAQSAVVKVRASRREPHFARLLAAAMPGAFELVEELEPRPGDSVWAYGSDETLSALWQKLPSGVVLHAGGPGYGVAVVDDEHADLEAARALARDVLAFDQRGCLSPRVACFVGGLSRARAFAAALAAELAHFAQRVPLGALSLDEAAEATRFRDTLSYAGRLFPAGPGSVAVIDDHFVLAPAGRHLTLVVTRDPLARLAPVAPEVTALGLATAPPLADALRRALPKARSSALGRMQCPAFDGPADLRTEARVNER
jgi:hypothetical protein